MVNYIATALMVTASLSAAEFVASVNNNQVQVGENFVLTLTLKGYVGNSQVSIEALKPTFKIHSQQQSFSHMIVNGRVISATIWKISLSPTVEGESTIPALTIETTEGSFTSQPLTIISSKGTVKDPNAELSSIRFEALVSKEKPYKNEPFIYTARLSSKMGLANIQMQKPIFENALVEMLGEPKIFESFADGVVVYVIDFTYIITPLKEGAFTIPQAIVQGGIPSKRKRSLGSMFDDDFDPFAMMQGYDQLKPFTITAKALTLDIQPPQGVSPWLPAHALTLEESIDEHTELKVGEPFTRSLTMKVQGLRSSQLPSLKELHTEQSFRIYADKPELADEWNDQTFHSSRKEQYTIIPQKSGSLTLPELVVEWWDVVKNEKRVAKVPARTLSILPADNVTLPEIAMTEVAVPAEPIVVAVQETNWWLYGVIAFLAALLSAVVIWGIRLRRKILQLTEKPVNKGAVKTIVEASVEQHAPPPKPEKPKQEKLPDLNPT